MPAQTIPAAAWKRRYDNLLEAPGKPKTPPFENLVNMIPMTLRILGYNRRERRAGRSPIDFAPQEYRGPVMGAPLGGLGGGTITRGWRGDFPRWQMHPGRYEYTNPAANAFSVWVKRAGQRGSVRALRAERPESGSLAGWNWGLDARKTTYHALYPRAWTAYQDVEPGITLTCRQVSPFLPGNYKESSTPAGTFVWTIENTGNSSASVGLLFTWQNGTGGENDRAGGHHNELFTEKAKGGDVTGVALHHTARLPKLDEDGSLTGESWEDPLTFAIAAQASEEIEVTYRTRFISSSSGMDVWGDFREDGRLEDTVDEKASSEGMAIGAALAATVEVPAGETREVAFSLAWDMPIARFSSGSAYYRRYTKFYGREGNSASKIARDALVDAPKWEKAIEKWQKPILDVKDTPDWYKGALFNELYYLADGGTIWTDGEVGGEAPGKDDLGHFAYLESHEYAIYNTYDVHFDASWALAKLWPELQLSLQRDVAAMIPLEDDEERRMTGTGGKAPRKVAGAIPHDLGSPFEDPWKKLNGYHLSDTSLWKDLNPKFALMVYRDAVLTRDKGFAKEMWPAVKEAMAYAAEADLDDDGLIENEGADQTYDTWEMHGPSAYCGGLWLAALSASAALADMVGEKAEADRFRAMLAKGQASYEDLLWNGESYDFDGRPGRPGTTIMAGQLAGQWYARACGLPPIIPEDHIQLALRKVFDSNVMEFEEGEMGAVNGMLMSGAVSTISVQSQEVWTGTTYALAATMIQEGMRDEAFRTAEGIVRMTYRELGYWFATPEAWDHTGDYRALGYMRPLAIWAMQHALEQTK